MSRTDERNGAAVIFDMDGVLVDSLAAHRVAWAAMAADAGLPFDPARFAAAFGRTGREMFAEIWGEGRFTDAQLAELGERREAAYRRAMRADFAPMPGARTLIGALHGDGFALAVGSSGPIENVEMVLELLGAGHLFGSVVTGRDVRRGKPDPEVFLTAAARLGVPPHRCAVIEDAPAGIAAANAAGMTSVALAAGGLNRAALSAARRVVEALDELSPALIRSLLDAGAP